MVYNFESGVDQENWRRVVAGASALIVSAALPILSGLLFQYVPSFPSPSSGQTLGVSDEPEKTDDSSSTTSDSSQPSNDSTNLTATTSSNRQGAASPPAITPAVVVTTSPSTPSTTDGGRGGGGAAVTEPPCGCPEAPGDPTESGGETTDGISATVDAGVGPTINATVSPNEPLDSTVQVEL